MEDHAGVTRHIGVPWTSKEVPVDRLLQWAICGVRGLAGGPDNINTGPDNTNINNNINDNNNRQDNNNNNNNNGQDDNNINNNNNCNNNYDTVSIYFFLKCPLFEFKQQSVFF